MKYPFFCILILLSFSSFAQTTQVEFGQNRVQFHDFDFLHYESDNLHVYFYPGGQDLGKFVVLAGEEMIKLMDDNLDYHINSKIEILVYNDITDMAQTNIGMNKESYNVGGTTRLIDNKLFVYFDGNHNNLLESIKKGFAELYIRSMMTGGNLQEILQNTFLLNLPTWYKPGLANYIGNHWSTSLDNELKNYLLTAKKASLKKLSVLHPELGGHAIWHYVETKYGKESIQDILYLTRINRSANNGFEFSIGSPLEKVLEECEQYYINSYASDTSNTDDLNPSDIVKIKSSNKKSLQKAVISPDGKFLAYSIHDGGFFKLFLKDLTTGKKKKIGRGGFKSDDYPFDNSYPIMAWSNGSTQLSAIYETADKIKLKTFDNSSKLIRNEEIRNLQRIYQMNYAPEGNKLVLSVQNKSYSDIFLYDLNTTALTPITNDIFDDLYPVYYVQDDTLKGILFSSNRNTTSFEKVDMDTLLPLGNFDLYFYPLNSASPSLSKITSTNFGVETYSVNNFDNTFSFLSNESGISNIYSGKLESYISGYDTLISVDPYTDAIDTSITPIIKYRSKIISNSNFSNNALQITPKRNFGHLALIATAKKPTLVHYPFQEKSPYINTFRTEYESDIDYDIVKEDGVITSNYITDIDSLLKENLSNNFDSDFNNTIYTQTEKDSIKKVYSNANGIETIDSETTEISMQRKYTPYYSSRITAYTPRFTSDYVVTQVDNSLMPFAYQNYNINGGAFNTPSLNGMITFGVSDILENHKIIGGFRIPTDFDGTEVFASYTNLKHRIDQRYLFYRSSDKIEGFIEQPLGVFNYVIGRPKTHYLEGRISYPFDVVKSLRLTVGYRNDKLMVAYTDTFTLAYRGDVVENWSSVRLEYVQDDSKEIQFNIPNGLKYKVYTEFFKNWNEKKSEVFTLGFDARYYLKIHRNIIWANRLAGATSFGSKKILYYLGGVDSWLNPKYDYANAIDFSSAYAFQTVVTNMRGFPQNVRNGSSFTVLNSELRVPLFSYLIQKPMKSSFFKNFQIVGFLDIGAAYKGLTLFDEKNPFRTQLVTPPLSGGSTGNPLEVTVNYFRNPIVYSYGVGLRSSLLGYFVRLDAAWAKDGINKATKPQILISLSKDF